VQREVYRERDRERGRERRERVNMCASDIRLVGERKDLDVTHLVASQGDTSDSRLGNCEHSNMSSVGVCFQMVILMTMQFPPDPVRSLGVRH
jgi:hypothetical protein